MCRQSNSAQCGLYGVYQARAIRSMCREDLGEIPA